MGWMARAPVLAQSELRHVSPWQLGRSDVGTFSKGVRGTAMSAFSFDAMQMPQILAYIRSMGIVRPVCDGIG